MPVYSLNVTSTPALVALSLNRCAEGVNMGPELKDKAIAAALAQVQAI